MDLVEALLSNMELRIRLFDEPSATEIVVTPNVQQQHLVGVAFFELDHHGQDRPTPKGLAPVLSFEFKRKHLVGMLMAELWCVHSFMQEPSYQKDRPAFPHGRLVRLNKRWNESSLGPSYLC